MKQIKATLSIHNSPTMGFWITKLVLALFISFTAFIALYALIGDVIVYVRDGNYASHVEMVAIILVFVAIFLCVGTSYGLYKLVAGSNMARVSIGIITLLLGFYFALIVIAGHYNFLLIPSVISFFIFYNLMLSRKVTMNYDNDARNILAIIVSVVHQIAPY